MSKNSNATLAVEEGVLQLRIEKLHLRLDQAKTSPARQSHSLSGLAAITDAALVATLEIDLESAQARLLELQSRPRPVPSEADEAQSQVEGEIGDEQRDRSNSISSESVMSGHASMFRMSLEEGSPEKKPPADIKPETESLRLRSSHRISFHNLSLALVALFSLLNVANMALQGLPPK